VAEPPGLASGALRPRLEPVQARSRRNRRNILDAAQALLKAQGVHKLTTSAIAAASGVSVGALYRFFPNKESIICRLYEEKLNAIRLSGAESRPSDPANMSWRDYFGGLFRALKGAERKVDFDFSLFNAVFTLPELARIDLRHGVAIADAIAADMKLLGSRWSDEALFDLAVHLYALDFSTWMCWRYAGRYSVRAVDRAIEASLAVMRPAMEGEPEPRGAAITRASLLAELSGPNA